MAPAKQISNLPEPDPCDGPPISTNRTLGFRGTISNLPSEIANCGILLTFFQWFDTNSVWQIGLAKWDGKNWSLISDSIILGNLSNGVTGAIPLQKVVVVGRYNASALIDEGIYSASLPYDTWKKILGYEENNDNFDGTRVAQDPSVKTFWAFTPLLVDDGFGGVFYDQRYVMTSNTGEADSWSIAHTVSRYLFAFTIFVENGIILIQGAIPTAIPFTSSPYPFLVISTDNGGSWKEIFLPDYIWVGTSPQAGFNLELTARIINNRMHVIWRTRNSGGNAKLIDLISDDGGDTWNAKTIYEWNQNDGNAANLGMTQEGTDRLFVMSQGGTIGNHIFMSTNNGESWEDIDLPTGLQFFNSIWYTAASKILYAGGNSGITVQIYRKIFPFGDWEYISDDFPALSDKQIDGGLMSICGVPS